MVSSGVRSEGTGLRLFQIPNWIVVLLFSTPTMKTRYASNAIPISCRDCCTSRWGHKMAEQVYRMHGATPTGRHGRSYSYYMSIRKINGVRYIIPTENIEKQLPE